MPNWKECFKGRRILVAEDDELNYELMRDILVGMGCVVECAQDGIEAVDKAKVGAYQLIFMDIRMPRKDGIEATQEIREWEKEKGVRVPIIALSASVLDQDLEKVLRAGVDDFILKPIKLVELREKMATYLPNTNCEK